MVLAALLSVLAVASAVTGAFLGTLGAIVALSALLSINVLGGRRTELRTWLRPRAPREAVRRGSYARARVAVREAASGNRFFRKQISETLARAAAARGAGPIPPGVGSPELRGQAYLLELVSAVEAIERD